MTNMIDRPSTAKPIPHFMRNVADELRDASLYQPQERTSRRGLRHVRSFI